MNKYFSYSDDAGFELHSTIDEAKLASEQNFNWYEECATDNGEWPNEVESVCYGELVGLAVDMGEDYKLIDLSK